MRSTATIPLRPAKRYAVAPSVSTARTGPAVRKVATGVGSAVAASRTSIPDSVGMTKSDVPGGTERGRAAPYRAVTEDGSPTVAGTSGSAHAS